MSQGKEWDKDEVIKILEPYFKLGCNVTKACNYAGVPRTTVQTWIEDDETLRLKVGSWQNEVSNKARKVLANSIELNTPQTALEWLKRKEKDEFSERTEQTGANGEPITVSITKYADKPSI